MSVTPLSGYPRAEHTGIRYVAIGDSIARGFVLGRPRRRVCDECDIRLFGVPLRWFDHPEVGYPRLLACRLSRQTGQQVDLVDALTCSGAGTGTWWASDDAPSSDVVRVFDGGADLVTVTVGANDLLRRWLAYVPARHALGRLGVRAGLIERLVNALAPGVDAAREDANEVERRLGALLRWMRRWMTCPIIVTTYYTGEDNPTVEERLARPLNDAIRRAAYSAADITVVDLVPEFAGRGGDADPDRRLVDSGDQLHPTAKGQLVIARAISDSLATMPGRFSREDGWETKLPLA